MKGYFFLLAFLYLVQTLMNLLVLFNVGVPIKALLAFGNVVFFSLALLGSYALAFRKTFFRPGFWTLLMNGVLVWGGFTVMVYGYGEMFGLASPSGSPGILNLGLLFLPYLLFAIPVIVYQHERRKAIFGEEANRS